MNIQAWKRLLVLTAASFVVALTFSAELGLLSQVTPQTQSAPQTLGSREFSDRVQDYVMVQKQAGAGIPPLATTDKPEVFVSQGQALAQKIRELRVNAKRGDIFTPAASEALAQTIKTVFAGPGSRLVQGTIQAGEPLKGFRVEVNQTYPNGLAYTTFPPTLLLKLPRLPDDISYRILGSDLLLVDTKCGLIVDYLPGVVWLTGR